jgi:hypothetical protein
MVVGQCLKACRRVVVGGASGGGLVLVEEVRAGGSGAWVGEPPAVVGAGR